jgi:hypothetical protein
MAFIKGNVPMQRVRDGINPRVQANGESETILGVNHDAMMEQRSEVETRESPEVDQLHVTVGN